MAVISSPVSAVLRLGEGENRTHIMSLRNVRTNLDAPSAVHIRAGVENIRARMVDNVRLTITTEIAEED